MTNYEKITKDQETLIKFLDEYGNFDGSPWQNWFNEHYCSKCESAIAYIPALDKEAECAWCELMNKCRFFQDKEQIPNNAEIIEMWLEEDSF